MSPVLLWVLLLGGAQGQEVPPAEPATAPAAPVEPPPVEPPPVEPRPVGPPPDEPRPVEPLPIEPPPVEPPRVEPPPPEVPRPQLPAPPEVPPAPRFPGPVAALAVALPLALITVLMLLSASLLGQLKVRLLPDGLLPRALVAGQLALRLLAVLAATLVVVVLLPPFLRNLLPWVLLAAAAALGWSSRDVLPDMVAGLALRVERRIRPGQRVTVAGRSGTVLGLGLRATSLRDEEGRTLSLPNRVFVTGPVTADQGRWPPVEVRVRVPRGLPPARVRRVLEEACLVSPYLAPTEPPLIAPTLREDLWQVRARLMDDRHAERFSAALREQVQEALTDPEVPG